MSNVSSDDLKYGFFNATQIEVTDPETGETAVTYDRLYNAETFNKYFEGIISKTGVFAYSGTPITQTSQSPYEQAASGGWNAWGPWPANNNKNNTYETTCNAFKCEPSPTTYGVIVHPGKAMINGYWVELLNAVTIPLTKPSSPSSGKYRRDLLVIRWYSERYIDPENPEAERTFDIVVSQGSMWDAPEPVGNTLKAKDKWPYYEGSAVEGDEHYIDLPIAEITVDSSDGETLQGSWSSRYINRVGGKGCPFITHLVCGPAEEDVDAILSNYIDHIRAFLDTLEGDLSVDTKITEFEWPTLTYNGSQVGYTLTDPSINYEYSNTDVFDVYYNGLKLGKSEWYKTVSEQGVVTIYIGRQGSPRTPPKGNTLLVRVIKSFIGEFPFMNGDELSY